MPLANAAITMGKISLGFSLFKIPRGHIVGFGLRAVCLTVLEVISTEYLVHYLNGSDGSFVNENIAGCLQKADSYNFCFAYILNVPTPPPPCTHLYAFA